MSSQALDKGGRAGSKGRKQSKPQTQRAREGVDGVAAWSTNSLKDFAADQQLLMQSRAQEASQTAAEAALRMVDLHGPTSQFDAQSFSSGTAASSFAAHQTPNANTVKSDADTETRNVDGSLLEGGGQVLRNAFIYAALLHTPLHITQIRAGRASGGGLRAQHLAGLQLVQRMSGGMLRGAALGVREVYFTPRPSSCGACTSAAAAPQKDNVAAPTSGCGGMADNSAVLFEADAKTAGATGLLLQVALPMALFSPHPVHLVLRGGTNAAMAPLVDYSSIVLAPLLQRHFGVQVQCDVVTRGWFPRGGGEVHVRTQPVRGTLPPLRLLQRGQVVRFGGKVVQTRQIPQDVGDRIVQTATRVLRREAAYRAAEIDLPVQRCTAEQSPHGEGCSVLLTAHTDTGCILGASGIGTRGMPAEQLAEQVATQLLLNLDAGGCVDEYAQDQLVFFAALAAGTSRFKCGPLTLHTRTCLHWAQQLAGAKVSVHAAKGNEVSGHFEPSDSEQTFIVQIAGIGHVGSAEPGA